MDQETIRLLATAVGAVIAGLGGAVIAGGFNRRSTRDTIRATEASAQAQREYARELEHSQWLKDKKVALYTDYIDKFYAIFDSLDEIKDGIRDEGKNALKLGRQLLLLSSSVRVLWPTSVNAAVLKVMFSMQVIATLIGGALQPYALDDGSYTKAVTDFRHIVTELERQIAKDLGLDWKA